MQESRKEYFVEMVLKHKAIIYKICNLYASEHDREDLEQEIIYQMWKSFAGFKGESKFQTWMYRISLNTALLSLRSKKVRHSTLTEKEIEIPHEAPDILETNIQELYRHISKLDKIDKGIIFLYLEKCSYEEIAGMMGMSEKNVSVRIVRIKEKLRNMFNVKNS
ncbi:MAG: sigma-70 family RNA polymerase sigma factor [Cyclobacteriaceae bacterium]|nr:sigma-70 family RNA polymerase sigma factor [Cyclobacteriaceae bacterium]